MRFTDWDREEGKERKKINSNKLKILLIINNLIKHGKKNQEKKSGKITKIRKQVYQIYS